MLVQVMRLSIREKPVTEPDVRELLANYQAGSSYKFRPTNG